MVSYIQTWIMEGRTDTDVDLVLAGILLEVLSDT